MRKFLFVTEISTAKSRRGSSLDEISHAAIANPEEDPIRHVVHREAKGLWARRLWRAIGAETYG